MAIRDTILTLKNKEGTLTNNKVCNFAYDDTAFADDSVTGANGVVNYNYNNHNNIPVKDNAVIKVNPTITSKGFRSQVSTLPRMLLNHIFGRVSYNLNKTVDTFNATLQALYSAIGQANGIATLDNTGRLPYSQLPLSAVEYKGAWNASTNTPALSSGSGTFGDEYIVSVQGTQNLGEGSVTYRVGDRVIYNGSIWQRIPSSAVRSVNTKTPDANGNVTVNAGDIVTPDVYGYDKSEIGVTWAQASGSFTSSYSGDFVTAGDLTVACRDRQLLWSEDFGMHWHEVQISNLYRCYAVYHYNGIWLATLSTDVSGGGIIWSNDGKNWNNCTFTDNDYYARAITSLDFDGTKFIACSASYNYIFTSTDGKTWSSSSYSYADTITGPVIKYANGTWVITLSASNSTIFGAILTSSDGGVNWTTQTSTKILGLAFGKVVCASDKNLWVVNADRWEGGSAFIFISNDNGVTWSKVSSLPSYNISIASGDILYVNGEFIVPLGYAGSYTESFIFKTTDFVNWILLYRDTGYYFTHSFFSLRFNRYLFTGSGRVLSTSDLSNFQLSNLSVYGYLGETKIAIVGNVYSNIMYSEGSRTNNVKTLLDWLIYAVDNLISRG